MDKWMDRWMDGWMGGWFGAWVGGWVDGWAGGWMDGWMDGERWVDVWDRWMDGWVDGWMDGQMDQLVEGQVDRQIDAWMDRWTDLIGSGYQFRLGCILSDQMRSVEIFIEIFRWISYMGWILQHEHRTTEDKNRFQLTTKTSSYHHAMFSITFGQRLQQTSSCDPSELPAEERPSLGFQELVMGTVFEHYCMH